MMRYLILTICVVTAGCATTPTAEDGGYSELYSGRPQTAFATEIPPESAQAALRTGDAALAQGDTDRAMYHYIHSLELDDSSPIAFYRLGAIHAGRGNSRMAVRAFQYALERNPDHAATLEELGLIMLKQERLEQARDYLQRAVTSAPDRVRSHSGLGIIADLNGDHALATRHFETALALQPQSADILNNLGYSSYLARDWDFAELRYREALQIDGEHEPSIRNLALLQVRRGDPERALGLLRQVATPAAASNDVGYLCMLAGRHECAERYFQQATALSASYYALAHENLARNRDLARAPAGSTAASSAAADLDTGVFADPGELPIIQTQPLPAASATAGADTRESGNNLYLRRYVLADILNVRAASNETGMIVDRIERGRVVRILRRDGAWAYVLYWREAERGPLTRKGWVHESFLSERRAEA